MRREATAARARETERQQERYLKGLGRFSPKKMRLGACEKMRLSEGGGFLGAFGRTAAKAGRTRTAAATGGGGGGGGADGGGGGAKLPARAPSAQLRRKYSATESAARRLRRDVHTQGLELGEVVAERRELQARLLTRAVQYLPWLPGYGYLLWLLTMATYYGASYRRALPSRSAGRARAATSRRPRRCVPRSSRSRRSRRGVVDSGAWAGRQRSMGW